MEAHNESMSALYRGAGKLVSAITGGHASAQAQKRWPERSVHQVLWQQQG